jgi:hypothetical protein
MSMVSILLVHLSLLASPDDPLLDGYRRENGAFGVVYHRGWPRLGRQDMVSFIERTLRQVEQRLQRTVGRQVTVVLVPGYRELERIASKLTGKSYPEWILGLALPRDAWILVRGDGRPVSLLMKDRPKVTLVHEVSHLVIHRRADVAVPRWFDEGVCMYVAGDHISRDDEALICALARIGGLFPTEDLERRFPRLHQPGTIAYQQSFLMVRYLVEKHGEAVLAEILDGLEKGDPFAAVYSGVTGLSWDGFEPEFKRWVVGRLSLFEVVGGVLNVWTLITLLALVAILRSLLRTRKLRAKLRRQDEGHGPHPEE